MPSIRRLTSVLTSVRRVFGGRDRSLDESDLPPQSPAELQLDAGEEFQKIQRGLRRLSLASDRSGEILQAVSTRLDEIQQTLMKTSRPQRVAIAVEEPELLRLLDQLDRASGVADLPTAARALIDEAKSSLLASSGWKAVALAGAKPEGAGIRIAEFLGESAADGATDVRIHRILEQGYRRADGTLLRPGVVIAAPGVVTAEP